MMPVSDERFRKAFVPTQEVVEAMRGRFQKNGDRFSITNRFFNEDEEPGARVIFVEQRW